MKLHTTEANFRKTTAVLDEEQMRQLIATAVAVEANIDITQPNVGFKVIISTRDRTGTAGFEKYAEVTITEDLREATQSAAPQPNTNSLSDEDAQ